MEIIFSSANTICKRYAPELPTFSCYVWYVLRIYVNVELLRNEKTILINKVDKRIGSISQAGSQMNNINQFKANDGKKLI